MTELSPQQLEVISAVRNTKDNIMVHSCAGSGKTTAAVGAVNQAIPPSRHVICCAFNTRIAGELRERMPGANTTCKTFNALGHQAWGKRIRKFARPNQWKSSDIRRELGFDSETFPDLPRLIGLAKSSGLVPKGAPGGSKGIVPDEPEVWQSFIDEQDLDCGTCPEPIETAREALVKSVVMAWKGEIDFDDQLYMTAIYDGEVERGADVLVDEVQDVAPIQRLMIHKMDPARLLAFGDPHQAIYGFRGADYTSVEAFTAEFGCKVMPLTVSFRCPKSIVAEARRWVSHIEPHPKAPEGKVKEVEGWGPPDMLPGDVILCRNNKPLIEVAFLLLRAGVRVRVLGRDIGENLMGLVKRVGKGYDNLQEVMDLILVHSNEQKAKLAGKGKHGRAAMIEDKCMSIACIAEKLLEQGETTKQALLNKLDQMFSTERQPITLSTVHRAKGLEWRRVWWLDPYLIPSKFARTEVQIQQERNLAYVAITRAKQELIKCRSERFVP